MADDIAIDIRLQPPSKSTVVKTVEELQRAIADAASRGEKVGNAGQYFLGSASSSSLQATAARMGMGNGAQGIVEAMRQRGMQQLADANKATAIGGGAPGIAEKMKAEALSRWEAERKANSELTIFGKHLGNANKMLSFAGIAGIGVGTIAAITQSIERRAMEGYAAASPGWGLRMEQAEQDYKGATGRRMRPLAEGNLKRERDWADAMADKTSLLGRGAETDAKIWNSIKGAFGWVLGVEGQAEAARAKGISSVGAGGFLGAGQFADTPEAVWKNMASGILQSPGTEMKDLTSEIRRLNNRLEQLDSWTNPGDKNWMTEEKTDIVARLNSLGVRR